MKQAPAPMSLDELRAYARDNGYIIEITVRQPVDAELVSAKPDDDAV